VFCLGITLTNPLQCMTLKLILIVYTNCPRIVGGDILAYFNMDAVELINPDNEW